VALIDNEEATLKRYKRQGNDKVRLIPENSTLSPMTFTAERVQIQGIVIGQMRRYE
jgi:repressor LexA